MGISSSVKSWTLGVILVGATLASGCTSKEIFREEAATRIAAPVFLQKRVIKTPMFNITVRERVYEEGQPAMLYIEGDGDDWLTFEKDPGPVDPTALRLAAMDSKTNVIYMNRSCQETGEADECPSTYWGSSKYSPEVIDSMSAALDNIRANRHVTGFHVIGFGGGAAVAIGLAAQRQDILSIRTVAGILDTVYYANLNKKPYPANSINPIDIAPQVAHIPQRHFVGQQDPEVPPALFHSFDQAMGQPSCSDVSIVDNATHQQGWAEQWKVLLALPVDCPVTEQPAMMDEPFEPANNLPAPYYNVNKGVGYLK
ncbi:MAG: alpha/beta fold hydrolase [Pseudobdellovibrionaceae bacterium]